MITLWRRRVGTWAQPPLSASCSTTSSPSRWTLGSSADANQFGMQVNNGSGWLDLSGGAQPVGQIYSGQNKAFDLQIALPTSVTAGHGVQQTITVTITAVKD